MSKTQVISTLDLSPDTLRGEIVIVTGAGGGVGYEAARALLWLGANIVIAEINGCQFLLMDSVIRSGGLPFCDL